MVARGRVQNGVVVLEDGVRLPEGQEVKVELRTGPSTPLLHGSSSHSVLDIPAVSLGPLLFSPAADHDLLGEMLESRP